MIRRDYLLRMIEEMIQALARIASLTRAKQHGEATAVLDQEFQKLIGSGAEAVATLSETELMARLLSGESTQIVREKSLLLVALLKEAGAVHAALNRTEESRACYLKALNLLLQARLLEDAGAELPGYVPKIEDLRLALKDSFPSNTRAALMQHYERLGDFADAEDQLFEILGLEANAPHVLNWGRAFYERLLRLSDGALVAGNLPRSEVEASLAELQQVK
jgi:tetratricopeptide (TPR) repeat protein